MWRRVTGLRRRCDAAAARVAASAGRSGPDPEYAMSLTPEWGARIESLLAQHTVVLFMKGTRAEPRCGFSAGAARTLAAVTPDFHDVDVIADPELREA